MQGMKMRWAWPIAAVSILYGTAAFADVSGTITAPTSGQSGANFFATYDLEVDAESKGYVRLTTSFGAGLLVGGTPTTTCAAPVAVVDGVVVLEGAFETGACSLTVPVTPIASGSLSLAGNIEWGTFNGADCWDGRLSASNGSLSLTPATITVPDSTTSTSLSASSAQIQGDAPVVYTFDFADQQASGTINVSGTCTLSFDADVKIQSLSSSCTGSATATVSSLTDNQVALLISSPGGESCTGSATVTGHPAGESTTGKLICSAFGFGGGVFVNETTTKLVQVTRGIEPAFTKAFNPVPVFGGGLVNVTYSITNTDRDNPLTDVTFTDDFSGLIAGLEVSSAPANPCGSGSSVSGTSVLTLAGGQIAPTETCEFTVVLAVPVTATAGVYTSESGALEGTTAAGPLAGGFVAAASFIVSEAPVVALEFNPDTAVPNTDALLDVSISNPSTAAVDSMDIRIATVAIANGAAVEPIAAGDNICGGVTVTNVSGDPGYTSITGGSIAGQSDCTFTLKIAVPNTSTSGQKSVDVSSAVFQVAGNPVIGVTSGANVTIPTAPQAKVQVSPSTTSPGETVTITVQMENSPENDSDASQVGWTLDVESAVAGAQVVGLPKSDVCGAGSTLTVDTSTGLVTLAGATIAPGEDCEVSFQVVLPDTVTSGSYTFATSDTTASYGAVATAGAGGTATMQVQTLTASHVLNGAELSAGATPPASPIRS